MNEQRQEEAFKDALTDLVQRFYDEFDLSYPQMVGVLEMTKQEILADAGEYVTVDQLDVEVEDEDDEDPPNIPE